MSKQTKYVFYGLSVVLAIYFAIAIVIIKTIHQFGLCKIKKTVTNLRPSFLDEYDSKSHNITKNDITTAVNFGSLPESRKLERCTLLLKDGNIISKTYERVLDLTTDEQVTETLRKGCDNFVNRYEFMESIYVTKEESQFPIAYSILVHEQLHQLSMLLSAIYRRQNLHCIHIDAKSDSVFRNGVKMISKCFPNVFISTKSERVVYASFSKLQADIHCMRDLLGAPRYLYNWTYVINLCDQDFPISTNYEIVRQLKQLKNKNTIVGTRDLNQISIDRTKYIYKIVNITAGNSEIHEEVRSTNTLHDPPPFNMTQVKNLAYATFTRDFLQWALVDSKEGAALLNWSLYTHTPDEHFWGMLNVLPSAPGGTTSISWWGVARAVWWNGKARTCNGYWTHNICVFGTGDLSWVVKQPHMFANKFDVTYDVTPVMCLREFLNQRTRGENATWNYFRTPRVLP